MGPGKACPGQTEPRASTAHALHRPGPCPSAASHGGIPAPLLLSSQSHLSPWPPGTLWTRSSSLGGHQVLLLAMQMWFQAPGRGRGHLAGAEVGEVGRPGLCLSDPQLQLPERRDPPRSLLHPPCPARAFPPQQHKAETAFCSPLRPSSQGAGGPGDACLAAEGHAHPPGPGRPWDTPLSRPLPCLAHRSHPGGRSLSLRKLKDPTSNPSPLLHTVQGGSMGKLRLRKVRGHPKFSEPIFLPSTFSCLTTIGCRETAMDPTVSPRFKSRLASP